MQERSAGNGRDAPRLFEKLNPDTESFGSTVLFGGYEESG
jgi:hypothetical protein